MANTAASLAAQLSAGNEINADSLKRLVIPRSSPSDEGAWTALAPSIAGNVADFNDMVACGEVVCEKEVEDCVANLRAQMTSLKGASASTPPVKKPRGNSLGENYAKLKRMSVALHDENACAGAILEYVWRQLSRLPEVLRFREQLPGGKLLTLPQAWAFLTTPTTKYFSFAQLRAWDIDPLTPYVGASKPQIVVREAPDGYKFRRLLMGDDECDIPDQVPRLAFTIQIDAADATTRWEQVECDYIPHIRLLGEFDACYSFAPMNEDDTLFLAPHDPPLPPMPPKSAIAGYFDTALGDLLTLVHKLSRDYGEWDHLDIAKFILTGFGDGPASVGCTGGYSLSRFPVYDLDVKEKVDEAHSSFKMIATWFTPPEHLLYDFKHHVKMIIYGEKRRSENIPLFLFVLRHWDSVSQDKQDGRISNRWETLWNQWKAEKAATGDNRTEYTTSAAFQDAFQGVHDILFVSAFSLERGSRDIPPKELLKRRKQHKASIKKLWQ